MEYSTPKVTIDLEEYNELLEKAKPKEQGEAGIAKAIIAEILNTPSTLDFIQILNKLKKEGIGFIVHGRRSGFRIEAENILITKTKD